MNSGESQISKGQQKQQKPFKFQMPQYLYSPTGCYLMIQNVDFFGGDLYKEVRQTKNGSIRRSKQLIGDDIKKCCTVMKQSETRYVVYLKIMKNTIPARSPRHNVCFSVLLGKKV